MYALSNLRKTSCNTWEWIAAYSGLRCFKAGRLDICVWQEMRLLCARQLLRRSAKAVLYSHRRLSNQESIFHCCSCVGQSPYLYNISFTMRSDFAASGSVSHRKIEGV
jgi:hypothetical protein